MVTPNIKHIILSALKTEPETMKDLFEKVSHETNQSWKQFYGYMVYLQREKEIEIDSEKIYSLTKKGFDYLRQNMDETTKKFLDGLKDPIGEEIDIDAHKPEEKTGIDQPTNQPEIINMPKDDEISINPNPVNESEIKYFEDPEDSTDNESLPEILVMDKISRLFNVLDSSEQSRVLNWVNDRYQGDGGF